MYTKMNSTLNEGNTKFCDTQVAYSKWIEAADTCNNNDSEPSKVTITISGTSINTWGDKDKQFIMNIIAVTGVIVIVIIGAFVLSYVYISCDRNSFDSASNSYNLTTSSGKESQSSEHEPPFHFVSRSDWLAQPPDADLNDLELPVKRIIIAHTATNNCTNQGTCTFRVRHIQTFHMESQGWDDIGYNFLVGGDGSVYEGRGWNKEGAHTKGFNKRSICIAFIGTFNKMAPTQRQMIVTKQLIDQGIQSGILKADYALYGHRQLIHTESPGTALYDIIKTWPHWSEMYIQ